MRNVLRTHMLAVNTRRKCMNRTWKFRNSVINFEEQQKHMQTMKSTAPRIRAFTLKRRTEIWTQSKFTRKMCLALLRRTSCTFGSPLESNNNVGMKHALAHPHTASGSNEWLAAVCMWRMQIYQILQRNWMHVCTEFVHSTFFWLTCIQATECVRALYLMPHIQINEICI